MPTHWLPPLKILKRHPARLRMRQEIVFLFIVGQSKEGIYCVYQMVSKLEMISAGNRKVEPPASRTAEDSFGRGMASAYRFLARTRANWFENGMDFQCLTPTRRTSLQVSLPVLFISKTAFSQPTVL